MRRLFQIVLALVSLCACSTSTNDHSVFRGPYYQLPQIPPGWQNVAPENEGSVYGAEHPPLGSDISDLSARYHKTLSDYGIIVRGSLDNPIDGLQPDAEEIYILATKGRNTDFDVRDFGRLIAAFLPGVNDNEAVEALRADLSAMAGSPDSGVAAYAALIADSGPTNLSFVQNPFPDNRITAAQLALILYRLGVDIQKNTSEPMERRGDLIRLPQPTLKGSTFRNTLFFSFPNLPGAPANDPFGGLTHQIADAQAPALPSCQWPKNTPLWLKTTVSVYLPTPSKIFFQEVQKVYDKVPIKLAMDIINGFFAYAKVIAVYASGDVSIEMVNSPLRRVKDRRRGERRDLVATVRLDLGNWQFLGCFREALLGVGLKLDFPPDGPIEGAKVSWRLASGGQGVSWGQTAAGLSTAQIITPLVELEGATDDSQRIQTGNKAPRDFTSAVTNSAGRAVERVWGAPRKEPVPATAREIKKEFTVRVEVAPMPMSLEKFLSKAAISATGGVSGLAKMTISLPAELALQTRWKPASATFPVIDWGHQGYKLDQVIMHYGVTGVNIVLTEVMSNLLFCPVANTWQVSVDWTPTVGLPITRRLSCVLQSGHCPELDSKQATRTFEITEDGYPKVTIEQHNLGYQPMWFDNGGTLPLAPADECADPSTN